MAQLDIEVVSQAPETTHRYQPRARRQWNVIPAATVGLYFSYSLSFLVCNNGIQASLNLLRGTFCQGTMVAWHVRAEVHVLAGFIMAHREDARAPGPTPTEERRPGTRRQLRCLLQQTERCRHPRSTGRETQTKLAREVWES